MPIKSLRSLVLVIGVLACASLAFGQIGGVRGKVIGKDGNPLKGAWIKLERLKVKGNYKVKTNKKGNFFYAGLPYGRYHATLEVDGQVVDRLNNVNVIVGDTVEFNFDIQKLAARRKSGPSEADIASMSPAERQRYEEALKKRQKAISKNKELNDAFNAGMVALKMKNYATAVQSLVKASALDGSQHVIWGNLADAQSKLASTKVGADRTRINGEAITSYEKAIEIDGTNAAYYNNLGLLMVRAQRVEEGQMKLAEAAMLDPDNAARYFFNLGAIMVNMGNTDGAIQAFTRSIEANASFANAHYQLGMALVGKAKTLPDGTVVPATGTIEAFQKYVELEPNGQFAAGAQGMLSGLTASVETEYREEKKKKKRRRKKAS
tara:strand:- start:137570 stop:138703 length:1134 start_codon:yes stop_codon:yes gene_type:complete